MSKVIWILRTGFQNFELNLMHDENFKVIINRNITGAVVLIIHICLRETTYSGLIGTSTFYHTGLTN